ncbi:unnamed protein product [Malus baccata var. baccata]
MSGSSLVSPTTSTSNNTCCNQATDQGFYKITGKKREIRAEESKAMIGKKRILTFYEGRVPKAKKTDWVVHEYYLTKIEVGSRPTKQMTSRTGMSSGSSSAAPASEKEPMPPASATSSASLTSPPVISSATSWLPPTPTTVGEHGNHDCGSGQLNDSHKRKRKRKSGGKKKKGKSMFGGGEREREREREAQWKEKRKRKALQYSLGAMRTNHLQLSTTYMEKDKHFIFGLICLKLSLFI